MAAADGAAGEYCNAFAECWGCGAYTYCGVCGGPHFQEGHNSCNKEGSSTKIKLGGEDFYVTPTSLDLTASLGPQNIKGTVTVSGATIQGYNIVHVSGTAPDNIEVTLSENKLSATIKVSMDD